VAGVEFTPPPEGRGALLRTAVLHPLGTNVSIISIPNGTYQIHLTIVEEKEAQIFDLSIEGRVVQPKLSTIGPGAWRRLGPWTVDVTDGLLDVTARGAGVLFAALEVWSVGK
jgi:hypothetical protein